MPNRFSNVKIIEANISEFARHLVFLKAMESFAKAAVSKSGGWTFAKNKPELMVMNEALI